MEVDLDDPKQNRMTDNEDDGPDQKKQRKEDDMAVDENAPNDPRLTVCQSILDQVQEDHKELFCYVAKFETDNFMLKSYINTFIDRRMRPHANLANTNYRLLPIPEDKDVSELRNLLKQGKIVEALKDCFVEVSQEQPVAMNAKQERIREYRNLFYGEADKALIKALLLYDDYHNPNIHYGRNLFVTQSSGTGKTTILKKIADCLPSITICLRKGLSGFPIGDGNCVEFLSLDGPDGFWKMCPPQFLRYLIPSATMENIQDGSFMQKDESKKLLHTVESVFRANSFCASLFCHVTSRLDQKQSNVPILPFGEEHTIPSDRKDFLDKVVEGSVKNLQYIVHLLWTYYDTDTDPKPDSELDPQAYDMALLKEFIADFNNMSKLNRCFTNILCKPKLQQLYKKLRGMHTNILYGERAKEAMLEFNAEKAHAILGGKHLIVVGFDEAGDADPLIIKALQRIALECTEYNWWNVFTGTNSKLQSLVVVNDWGTSAREMTGEESKLRLLPPFYAVGFDQWNLEQNQDRFVPEKHEDIYHPKYIIQLGRPLWVSYSTEIKELNLHDVLSFPRKKLFWQISKGGIYFGFDSELRTHVVSLLNHRISLLNVTNIQLASELVDKNLLLYKGISLNHEYVHTRCPSEPILSFVSIAEMHGVYYEHDSLYTLCDDHEYHSRLFRMLRIFNKELILKRHIDRGLCGEMYGRLLLTIARDDAARKNVKKSRNKFEKIFEPILLGDFICSLFGSKLSKECVVHSSYTEGGSDVYDTHSYGSFQKISGTLSEILEGNTGMVNFTHFINLEDNISDTIPVNTLKQWYMRGCGVQCNFYQHGYDIFLPICLDWEKNLFSYALISIKFQQSGDMKNTVKMVAPNVVDKNGAETSPNFIAVLLDLNNFSDFNCTKANILGFTHPGNGMPYFSIRGLEYDCIRNLSGDAQRQIQYLWEITTNDEDLPGKSLWNTYFAGILDDMKPLERLHLSE